MNTHSHHTGRARRSVFATAIAVMVAVSITSTTAMATQPSPNQSAPGSVATPDTSWDALKSEAERDGTVPVIVGLRVENAPVDATVTDKTPGRLRVKADREPAIRGVRSSLEKRLGRDKVKNYRSGDGAPFVTMEVTTGQLDELRDSGADVVSVSRDETREAAGTSSYGSAAGQQLPNQWDYTRIGADWANNNGWTGKGMYVAVIDTGVDRTNPYVSGKVVNEACFATNGCVGGTSSSYSTTNKAGVVGAAAPCGNVYYNGGCAHGTHVAHTAAGYYGVARGANIIAINASHKGWSSKANAYVPLFKDSDVLWALWYIDVVLPKLGIVAAAVNISIGGGQHTTYCDNTSSATTYAAWINQLRNDYQIPVVISSGNDNYSNAVGSPACNSTAISVGNTTLASGVDAVFGGVSGGSNSNATLDLLAPGTDICSAVPKGLDNDGAADGWQCGWIGTSMAAPQVSGAIAILTQKRPTSTVSQLQTALARSGSTGGVAVLDSRNNITRTRINVANAVYYF